MTIASNERILVVDDDPSIREMLESVLLEAGYEVIQAENGFDALSQLRHQFPAAIISDLNMPKMSGFEFLSVVRRRFPDIPVMAMSGAYDCSDRVPGGVIADAFYSKGAIHMGELLQSVSNLIQTSAERCADHHRQSAPVWIPRNGKDSSGVPFVVLSCTECLRSFPLSVGREDTQEIQETPCLFCNTAVRYIVDFSLDVTSPRKKPAEDSAGTPPAPRRPSSDQPT